MENAIIREFQARERCATVYYYIDDNDAKIKAKLCSFADKNEMKIAGKGLKPSMIHHLETFIKIYPFRPLSEWAVCQISSASAPISTSYNWLAK